jgi:hypothetical protein
LLYFRTHPCWVTCQLVTGWLSPAQSFLVLGPIETYDHVLFFQTDFRCFETKPPFRREERSDYCCLLPRSCLLTTGSALILPRTALDQSVKLPLALPSTLILGFESRRDHIQYFYSLRVYKWGLIFEEWMDRSVTALGLEAPPPLCLLCLASPDPIPCTFTFTQFKSSTACVLHNLVM